MDYGLVDCDISPLVRSEIVTCCNLFLWCTNHTFFNIKFASSVILLP